MTDDKAFALLQALDQRTADGTIPWSEASEADSFIASFPKYSVAVRKVEYETDRGDERDRIEIDVINAVGRVLDTIDVESLGSYDMTQTGRRIYARARDFALGVEEAVTELLQELSPSPVGKAGDGLDEEEIPF